LLTAPDGTVYGGTISDGINDFLENTSIPRTPTTTIILIGRQPLIKANACNLFASGTANLGVVQQLTDNPQFRIINGVGQDTKVAFPFNNFFGIRFQFNNSGNAQIGVNDFPPYSILNTGSNYVATLNGQVQVDDLREAIPTITGNNTTYRLSTSASSNSNFYVGSAIYIDTGTGAGQLKSIIFYNPSTRVAVVNSAFATAPSSDSTYIISPNVSVNGDGFGAAGYAVVASNSSVNNFISKITLVNRGSGYTYATATITGNTGGVSNTASLKAIIPPVGGHGSDSLNELGVIGTGISVSYNTNESGFITVDNDYRKIAILKDPLVTNVTLTLDNEIGTFSTGETVYQISYKSLVGTCAGNTTTTTLLGSGTQFDNAFTSGDFIFITDTITGTSCLRVVDAITNSSVMSLTDELPFTTSFATIAHASVLATGTKTGNASPYITMSNAQPKFVLGKIVIGDSSGAVANVTGIDVNEKSYNNWNTFDNSTRIAYTAASGSMPEDAFVFQEFVETSNAYYHSANSTYVFLTSEKGPINADPNQNLFQSNGSAFFTLGSVKYPPDIVKGSGQVLYIENNSPISRSISQSETLRLIVKF
jgi:hypothetical protein